MRLLPAWSWTLGQGTSQKNVSCLWKPQGKYGSFQGPDVTAVMADGSQVGGKEGHADAEMSEVREPLCVCKAFRMASPMCPHPLTGIAWGMEVREYYFESLERDRRLLDRSASYLDAGCRNKSIAEAVLNTDAVL